MFLNGSPDGQVLKRAFRGDARLWATVLFVIAASIFWGLRGYYWGVTQEEPFSDMADYLAISEKFRCCWSLAQSDFWLSYAKPVLPIVGGLLFSLTDGVNLDLWRASLALITFASLVWLAVEVYLLTTSLTSAFAIAACVGLAKSSIFWSYKFATEGIAEALIYLVCAGVLYAHRAKDSFLTCFFLGLFSTIALYNRPNMILVIPAVFCAVALKSRVLFKRYSWRWRNLLGLSCGCIAIVALFAIRSYSLYGRISLSPTQGPYSFLWELGAVPVKTPAGDQTNRTAQQLQEEAPRLFRNDLEAATYAKSVVKTWVIDNWSGQYPQIIRNRIKSSIVKKEIALSKVPREQILPGFLNLILLDKSPVIFILGSIGLILMAVRWRRAFYILPAMALLPWIFGVFFLGDPRMLEPSLPLLIFGNVGLIILVCDCAARRYKINIATTR